MTIARTAYRQHIGRALGRSYWVESTATSTAATADEVIDTARTEPPDTWDGATILVGTSEATVRGSDPKTGRLFLDSLLGGGATASATAYKLLKGFTITDLDEAIDWAFSECYPHVFDPINDNTTVEEVTNTLTYTLTEAWRDITEVRREVRGANPTDYATLPRSWYEIRQGTAGLQFEAIAYTPETGINLWFIGKAIPTLAAAAASTSLLPWQLVVPGALSWLYEKGTDPSESALSARFAQEAQKQLALFEAAKMRYATPRTRRKAWTPGIDAVNDGASIAHRAGS